jgi:hypothetical protein
MVAGGLSRGRGTAGQLLYNAYKFRVLIREVELLSKSIT